MSLHQSTSHPAPAKLNLFLHVVGRRLDGYHLLQSLFVLLDHGDTIDIVPREHGQVMRVNAVPGVDASTDLSVRAALALKAAAVGRANHAQLGADITVHKRTPMGAGLGGGSSDAATVLMVLNRVWGLHLSQDQLMKIGLGLGADVPFFLGGTTALAEGVGEILTPVAIPAWWYVVLNPPVHVPTPTVFGHPDLTRNTPTVKIADFSATILANCRNDLQAVVLKEFPAVAASLAMLSAAAKKSLFGARMTGSGASVFAAFATEQDAREAFNQLSPEITGFVARGLDKHPLL